MTRNRAGRPGGGSREAANQGLEGRDEELQRGCRNYNENATAPGNRCQATTFRGRPAPAVGLEPTTL
jgi:hypothetical protein